MKLLERILVATDFTPGADDAVRMAVLIAKRFDAEIILLHVVPGVSKRYSDAIDMITLDVQAELQEAVELIHNEGVKEVQTAVAFGIPFEQITRQADERDAQVIIMGAQEGGKKERSGLGSTAAEVRRRANKAVCVVKPGAEPAIRKVLCPIDLTDASARALRNAIHFSRRLGAELILLMVAPCGGAAGDDMLDAEGAAPESEAEMLEHFVQDFDFHGVELTKLIRHCDRKPHEEILSVIRETQTDVVVMGSSGRRGLAHVMMGGVTRKIAQELPCSIVTIRREHPIQVRLDPESSDLEEHFKQAHELLALGFPEEAGKLFRHCITKNKMYVPAWEGLATVCERMGRKEEAKRYEEHAERTAQTLYHKEIEADVRSRHLLFRPLFGIGEDDT